MPMMSPVSRSRWAAAEERDLRQERVRCALAALEHPGEGQRQLEECHAIQPAKIDRAHLTIVVELEGRGDVGRLTQGHADGADPLADRQLAPPPLAGLRQHAVEDLSPLEDLRVLSAAGR